MALKQSSSAHSKGAFLPDASSVLYALLAGGVLIFILWPTLAILKESVLVDGVFSLERYRDLLTGNRTLLKNSLFVGWWTTLLAVLIGLCCALYVTRTSFRGKRAVLGVLLLTLISPPFVSSLSYIMLFGRRGLVTWRLLGLRWNPYGAHGVVLMESVGLAAVAAFLIMAVLRGIDRSLEQASFDLGAGRWETLLRVTLPLARPGIVTAALIVFIRSLSDFGTPMFIGGNYNVLATQAYMTAMGSFDLPKAAAISTLLVIPAFLVFLVYRELMAGAPLFSSKAVAAGEERPLPGAVRWVVFAVVWSFVLFEAMKYGAIFCGAFVRTWGVDFSFTLHHLKTLQLTKLDSLLRSVRYAFAAALAAGAMGVVLARFLGRRSTLFSRAVDFIADLPFILPGPFFGIAYLLAFNRLPEAFLGTGFLIVANCVYRQLSLGIKSGVSVLGQINPELEDAVRDQGGGSLAVLRDVIGPLLMPAFLVSFINTFTFTMTTIGGIIFLITPYTKVLTAEMFDAIQSGDIGASSVMASVIILVAMTVNVTFSWLFLKRRTKGSEAEYVSSVGAAR